MIYRGRVRNPNVAPAVAAYLEAELSEVWSDFINAYDAVVSTVDEAIKRDLGLPHAWLEVLARIYVAPEARLRFTALAGAVLFSKGHVSHVLKRMQASGLVVAQKDKGDGRAIYLSLTRKGREMVEDGYPILSRTLHEHFMAHLTARDLRTLGNAMKRIRQRESRRRDPYGSSARAEQQTLGAQA